MTTIVSRITGEKHNVEDDAFVVVRYKEYDPGFEEWDYCYMKIFNLYAEEAGIDAVEIVKIMADSWKAEEENFVYDFELYVTGEELKASGDWRGFYY